MRHFDNHRRLAAVLALAAGCLLISAACSGISVPADPGLMARMYGADAEGGEAPAAPASTGGDEDARRLYLNHCGKCHEPFQPGALTAGDWPRYVRKYGPRAGLFGRDRARVLAWLQAHAR